MFHSNHFCDQELISTNVIRAVTDQNIDDLKSLINSGAKIQGIKGTNEDTLLHFAMRNKDIIILEYLLSLDKIEINSFNTLGKTPLLMAVIQPNPRFVKVLIERGADVNLFDSEGNTPLHYASYYNFIENSELLLKHGADVNAQNNRGLTALHLVCGLRDDLEWIAMLLYYGADGSVPSWEPHGIGHTPFELTLINNKVEFQEILFDYVIDSCEKIPMLLGALVAAMEHGSELFPVILDNVSDVIFDSNELEIFINKIFYFKSDHLRLFINNFGYVIKSINNVNCNIIRALYFYVQQHLSGFHKTYSKLIENFYIIFDAPWSSYFVDNVNKSARPHTLSTFINMYSRQKLPLEPLSEMIYQVLSYGVELRAEDIDQIYCCFGDGQLFRRMLHMDIEKSRDACYAMPPLPALIYDVDVTIAMFFRTPVQYDFKILDKLVDYFAHAKIKDLCASTDQRRLIDKVNKLPDVPCLIELARNASRDCIIKRYHVKNSRQFYTVLKKIPICDEYKAIISFRRKLY